MMPAVSETIDVIHPISLRRSVAALQLIVRFGPDLALYCRCTDSAIVHWALMLTLSCYETNTPMSWLKTAVVTLAH